jgi:hypothetical protein
VEVGGARIAGNGGMGEGDRPVLPGNAAADSEGEAAACDPEKEDRRDPDRIEGGGGSMSVG